MSAEQPPPDTHSPLRGPDDDQLQAFFAGRLDRLPVPAGDTVTAVHWCRIFRDQADRQLAAAFTGRRLPAPQLAARRAAVIDRILTLFWHHLFQQQADLMTLVAVGGYGRAELYPCSDTDILILLPDGVQPDKERLAHFLTVLWDMGLKPGDAVRTVAQCVEEAARDITVATNLFEARPVTGSTALFDAMVTAIGPDRLWPDSEYFAAKLSEQRARHARFNDAFSNLEPHVKEGPGGLRDLQMIGWVTRRHFGAHTLHDLVTKRFLTEDEYTTLMDCQEFLGNVRFGLHLLTGRREDRLLFDYQKPLAEQFGYTDTDTALAVENFMRDYYRTITELSRLNEMLLQLFEEAILRRDESIEPILIDSDFQLRKGFLETREETVFARNPAALLRIFLVLQQLPEDTAISAATVRQIRRHRHLIDDAFRAKKEHKDLFIRILRQPRGITHQFRRMNRYGILAEYLPAFKRVVGLMQYDLFHVYTVDEHTLMVLRNARRFTVETFARENPLCSQVIRRLEKPELLYLACLFHDIAKGRGGDHSHLGAVEARRFCLDHGLSEFDSRVVEWLVRHHLIMSHTAQRRDIGDPDVITAFARQVGDQLHLDYLYLLTVADIRGTNPQLWTAWKDVLLAELYTATSRALRRGLENPIDKRERIHEQQEAAYRLLARDRISTAAIDTVWQRLDEDYFFRHSADEIAFHTRALVDVRKTDLPVVLVREQTERGGTEIFLYAEDQDYLFVSVTRQISQLGLSIQDARIITTRSGLVLDTFIVLDPTGRPLTDPLQLDNLRRKVRAAALQPREFAPPDTPPLARKLKYFDAPTEISFSSEPVQQRTVVEIITKDRPALLAQIAQAFAHCGCRIENAKIATFGHWVEDVFFITDHQGRALQNETDFTRLRDTLRKALEQDSGQRNAPDC